MEAQVPIKVIADRLGHANPAMTLKIYQHLTDQASALAVAALDKALAAPPAAQVSSTSSSAGTRFVDSTVDSTSDLPDSFSEANSVSD